MSFGDMTLVQACASISLAVMSVAVVFAFIRLVIGPSLPDRVVALDMIATLLVGMLVLSGILQMQPHPVRVATVLALVNFVGTVAFATYIRKKAS